MVDHIQSHSFTQVTDTWRSRIAPTSADFPWIHVILREMRLEPMAVGAQRLQIVR